MQQLTTDNTESAIEHYIQLQRCEQAIDLIRQALANDPENARLHYLWAFSCYRLEDYSEAEEQLLNALRYGADTESAYALYGDILLETGRWKEAEEAYLEGLRENPENAQIHASYAYLMIKMGHEAKGQKLLQTAVQLDPENPVVLHYQLLFQWAKSKKDDQLVALGKLVRHASNDLAIHINIGLTELYQSNWKAAREHFRQAFLLSPSDKTLLDILKDLDYMSHPLLAPLRWIDRVGGPAVVWLVGIGSITLLRSVGWISAAFVFALVYILVLVYTWTVPSLLKLWRKVRG